MWLIGNVSVLQNDIYRCQRESFSQSRSLSVPTYSCQSRRGIDNHGLRGPSAPLQPGKNQWGTSHRKERYKSLKITQSGCTVGLRLNAHLRLRSKRGRKLGLEVNTALYGQEKKLWDTMADCLLLLFISLSLTLPPAMTPFENKV